MLRRGTVAAHPLQPVSQYPTIHVQAPTFTGDSGALVARIVNGRPQVIGVASGMLLRTETTDSFFEERKSHMPMQLATVVPSAWLAGLLKEPIAESAATGSAPAAKSLLQRVRNGLHALTPPEANRPR
jgi:hypothetical protein